MNSEKQAVRVLAENLARAVRQASSQNTTVKNKSDIITASKIVGLPTALSSFICSLESPSMSGDAIAQDTLKAIKHIAAGEFDTITSDEAQIGRVYATFGNFITLVAQDEHIGNLDVENIRANLADIGLTNIGTANIDMTQIKRSSTGNAFIREGEFNKIIIDDLAVMDANIVNLAAGTILLNDTSGNLVEMYVDEEGNISTRQTSYDGNDIINTESLDGGRIVKNSITTEQLNVKELFALNGRIMDLIADNIDVTRIHTGSLDASVVKVINLTASDIITDLIKSPDYEMVEVPFVYPASNTYPSADLYPSIGNYVRRGFAIDFTNSQIYGGLYSATTDDLQDQIDDLKILTTRATDTTDSNGNINLGLDSNDNVIVAVYSPSLIVTPWVSGTDGGWKARVTSTSGNAVANSSVTVTIKYYSV